MPTRRSPATRWPWFKRLDGYEVKFLTGTDEHGQKVETAAANAGIDPLTFTDGGSQNFRALAGAMNFSNDDFIRTTEERHKKACQDLWKRLLDKGHIYLGAYEGWYSVRDEAFFTETEVKDGKAPTGAPVEWVEEPSYFFDLSKWQEPLLKYYEEHPDFIAPSARRNEAAASSSLASGTSLSRAPALSGVFLFQTMIHIMYVWLDALTNYITAAGYPNTDSEDFTKFWPADLHMVGKDILRFHAVYWPAFLMAAELPLPKRIFAHGWWMNEGQKMSKSLGNFINPYDLIDKYGLDQVRYFCLREMPFGSDGEFTHIAIVNRMNGELANDFGNLSQRVLSMIAKNCDGKVPVHGDFTDADRTLMDAATGLLGSIRQSYDAQAFNKVLDKIWQVVGDANRYVDDMAPWALKKTDPDRMATSLYVLADTIRVLGVLMQPIVPESASKMLDQLALGDEDRKFAALETRLVPGTELPKPGPVFPRYVEPDVTEA